MKRLCLLILASGAFAGCAHEGELITDGVANSCGDLGYTWTGIHYADSRIVVLPVSEIGAGHEWRFHLLPDTASGDPVNYREMEVTITRDPPAAWLNVSGKFSTGSVLKVCVPANIPVGELVKFDVEVENLGRLDPRAKVLR